MIDLLSKQLNENGPRIMNQQEEYPCCFVCDEKINNGQEYYILKNNKFLKRHTTCIRKTLGLEKNKSEDSLRRENNKKPLGSPKKRRAGGHGYSGGNGFINLK